jgi:DNA-binding transcriptional LysR family regulator
MQIAWDDLHLLLAIARAGSLSGAARALQVNHSTVFRRLQAAEAALGVRVFERGAEGYRPTLEGEEIVRHAERMDAEVLALERTVAGKDFRLAGSVRLTAPPHLAREFVAPLLPAFRRQQPDIVVELLVGDREYDLARREADLALRATAAPPPYLIGRRVLDLPWWVFAGADWPGPPPASVDELGRFPLIGPEASFLRLPVFAWLQAQFGDAAFVARASDLDTMAALARAGLGLAALPIDQQQPGLCPLLALDPAFAAGLWLLTHPDLRHVQRIRVFADFLAAALRDDPRLAPPAVAVAVGGRRNRANS